MTAAEYIRQVEWALGDLPWGQRRALVADLRNHLAELPPDTDLVTRLGTPHQYVADLRSAADLPRRRGVIALIRARRPRNLALVVLGLTAFGLVVGALAWIHSYQPLTFGNRYHLPTGQETAFGYEARVRNGHPFLFGAEIVNTGPFTVRVLGVPYGPYMPWKARLMMGPLGTSDLGEDPAQPFGPFDMHPGEHRYLFLQGVFTCPFGWRGKRNFGWGYDLSPLPVRYRFLWHTATAEIPVEPITFKFASGDGCSSQKSSTP